MQTDEVEKMSSAYAFAEARLCSYEAGKSDNAEQRRLLLRLRNSWIMVANELQIIEGVERSGKRRLAASRTIDADPPHDPYRIGTSFLGSNGAKKKEERRTG